LCDKDEDFGELYADCSKHPKGDFLIQEGIVFTGMRLCVLNCSTRELLIKEVHRGSLAGHYGGNKTLTMLKEHYYWPVMERDVQDILKRCGTCQAAKNHSLPHNLYTSLSIRTTPWVDVSVDLILGLSKTQKTRILSLLW